MKKIFLFFCSLVFSASVLFAVTKDEPKSITLDKALSLARENNISIKREQILLSAAQRKSAHSGNNFLPSISVSANNDIELPDLNGGENNSIRNNTGLEGKVSLSIMPEYFASIKKARLDYEAAGISFDESVFEISSQVKEMYFSLIFARQNLAFLKENLETARNQFTQDEERFRRGTLSEIEYLSSKIAYEKIKPELKTQELSFKKDLKAFCNFIGIEDEEIILSGSLEDFIRQYSSLFDTSMKENVAENIRNGNVNSIKNLEKQIESAQKGVSMSRLSAYAPSVNLSYSVSPVIYGEEQGRIKQSASIGISIPIENFFSFSKGADAIKEAQDGVKDLQLQLIEKKLNVNTEFNHIIKSLAQKEETIASYKEFVALAQSNYSTAKYAYSKGMTEFLSMQNASKENLEAKLNLQSELLETLKLYILLEKLSGKSVF